MWGKNCLNVGVFLVMVFVLFSCKKDPVDLGFEEGVGLMGGIADGDKLYVAVEP